MWLALFLTICWGSIANSKNLGLRLFVVWKRLGECVDWVKIMYKLKTVLSKISCYLRPSRWYVFIEQPYPFSNKCVWICDSLDLIWILSKCVLCGCVMSPILGIYLEDLSFINNYKNPQFWLVPLRYNAYRW